jgi:predicted DNA-binding antitoxin AbrB/MazE fold protein
VLVIQGYFENGVFTPNEPVFNVKGKQEAILTIREPVEEKQEQKNRTFGSQWTEILDDLQNCQEELIGEPERIHLRTPEEIDVL